MDSDSDMDYSVHSTEYDVHEYPWGEIRDSWEKLWKRKEEGSIEKEVLFC